MQTINFPKIMDVMQITDIELSDGCKMALLAGFLPYFVKLSNWFNKSQFAG
jgi:hypothetical protein